jgi:hypothetical protein
MLRCGELAAAIMAPETQNSRGYCPGRFADLSFVRERMETLATADTGDGKRGLRGIQLSHGAGDSVAMACGGGDGALHVHEAAAVGAAGLQGGAVDALHHALGVAGIVEVQPGFGDRNADGLGRGGCVCSTGEQEERGGRGDEGLHGTTSLASATSRGVARFDLSSGPQGARLEIKFETLHLPKKRPRKAKKVDKSVKNRATALFETQKVEFI